MLPQRLDKEFANWKNICGSPFQCWTYFPTNYCKFQIWCNLFQAYQWILFLSCFKAQNRDPTYYWTNGVGCNPFTFLERLHPSPHCSQEEPDENCISAVAVWRRDEHSDQAGGQPSTPGSTGRTWWDGEPAAGKRSSRQRSYQGHTETETLFNTLPHSSDTCFYWHGCSSSSCSRCLTLWP